MLAGFESVKLESTPESFCKSTAPQNIFEVSCEIIAPPPETSFVGSLKLVVWIAWPANGLSVSALIVGSGVVLVTNAPVELT